MGCWECSICGAKEGEPCKGIPCTKANQLIRRPMSEILEVDASAPVKTVDPEQFEMLWAVLPAVMRFCHPALAEDGTDAIWCPGQKCWWKTA